MRKMKSGTSKPILSYIGDLPPFRTTGITLSFENNLEILSEQFDIKNVQELRTLNQGVLAKSVEIIKLWVRFYTETKKEKPEIIYLNFPSSFLGAAKISVLLMIGISYGIKKVLHIHRGDFHDWFSKSRVNKWIANKAFKMSDFTIVLAKSQKEKLERTFPGNRFFFLNNTIEREHNCQKTNIVPGKFIYVSNYLESKGILDLLDVFGEVVSQNQSIKLDCFGSYSPGVSKEKLMSYQSDQISINKGIYGKRKFLKLCESSCFILPSWNEGQPLSVLEAMSVGLPVIASDVGLIREMVGDNYPYLFAAKNKQSLTEAINNFLIAPNNEQIGQELRKRYYSKYSRAKHRKKILQIFENISN